MSFIQSIGSEIKKTAATKVAGAVVGTATLAATGATLSYFAKSPSAPAQESTPAAVATLQGSVPAPPQMPRLSDAPVSVSSPAPEAPAQGAPAGGVTVEYQPDFGTAVASDAKDAADQAEEFLMSKKWTEGRNPNGMIVFVGKSSLPCGSEDPKFDECRRQAFDEAMLRAKNELAEYLSMQVAASMSRLYMEGDVVKQLAQARAAEVAQQPGMVEKLALLANSYIDEQLKARGVQFGEENAARDEAERQKQVELARKEAEQLLSSKEFRSAVQTAARAEVSALQAYRTFEYLAPGTKGSIAVVAVYSERSGQLQRALLGQGDPPSGAPKQSITDWARAQGAERLLYTFGTQPRVNENGELVLVAFGQATPIGNSEDQLDAAEDIAKLKAVEHARFYLGEMVLADKQQVQASRLKGFSDNTSTYESQSSFRSAVESEAKSLGMEGGLKAWRWKMRHPLSNKTTVGVVYVFSVSEALAANKLGAAFRAAGGAAGGPGLSTKRPAAPPAATAPKAPEAPGRPRSGNTGTGAEGDEP